MNEYETKGAVSEAFNTFAHGTHIDGSAPGPQQLYCNQQQELHVI